MASAQYFGTSLAHQQAAKAHIHKVWMQMTAQTKI